MLVLALVLLAAILLRRWQSRRALVRRLGELTRLGQAGQALAGAELDSARLAELVFEQAGQIVDASTFELGLYEADSYRVLISVVDGQRRPVTVLACPPDSRSLLAWLRDTRRSLLVRDLEREAAALPAELPAGSAGGSRSAVFVPLISRGCALGAVAIQSRLPNAFDEDDQRLLAIVANQAASAFEVPVCSSRPSGAPISSSCWRACHSASTSCSHLGPSTNRLSTWWPAPLWNILSATTKATASSLACVLARRRQRPALT